MTAERILFVLFAACVGLYGHHLGRESAPELVAYRAAQDEAAQERWAEMDEEYANSPDYRCDRILDEARRALEQEHLYEYGSPYEQ